MALIRQRKLSKQQLRRINKQQANSQYEDSELLDGIVIAHYGKQLEVQVTGMPDSLSFCQSSRPEVEVGEPEPFWQEIKLGDVWRCHSRTNLPMLAAGDRVRWIADPNTGLGRIEILQERKSLITRPDRYNKIKPVVANVDILAIVFAPLPLPSASLIDRYLLVAHHASQNHQIQPLLILNKADLFSHDNQGNEQASQQVQNLLMDYQKLGYDTLITSCELNEGYAELQEKITGKFVVFAGQSGVGKSSLINALLPNSQQSVNIISENSQLGQHTTTTSRLLPFENDDHKICKGGIIDTPGIREYGIWHLSPDDIIQGFVELEPLANQCKFRDCKHTHNTKGCALRLAIENGDVLERRVESLVRLQSEADTKDY